MIALDAHQRVEAALQAPAPALLEPAAQPAAEAGATGALTFRSLAEVARDVALAPIPTWLVRSIWPSDGYGILGAEDKAGKTWAMCDLGLTVAAGLTWLDTWPIDNPGPVLFFVGEGSERKILRRLHAIGRFYGLTDEQVDALPIRLCMRVPNLTSAQHVAEVQREVAANPPRLVILDPLYLAAGDTETSQLNKMGVVLGNIQYACQAVGAALIVAHHWNQSGAGTDRKRFTGAGTAEWGRVLISMSVLKRTTEDPDGMARSVVDLKLEVMGDEVADTEITVRRQVWSEDPSDLRSPMHYAIKRTHLDPAERAGRPSEYDAAQAAVGALRDFFATRPTTELSTNRLLTQLRETGARFADRAVKDAAGHLVAEGYLTATDGARGSRQYRLAPTTEGASS